MTHNMTIEYLRNHGPRPKIWLGYVTSFLTTLAWLCDSKYCLLHWTWGLPKNFNTYLYLHTFPSLLVFIYLFVCLHGIITLQQTELHTTHCLNQSLTLYTSHLSILTLVTHTHTHYLKVREPQIFVGRTTLFLNLLTHTLTISHYSPHLWEYFGNLNSRFDGPQWLKWYTVL